MAALPKADYETMVAACDVGMIFLDHRFTIPNFPSRMLSYMKAKVPILAVTDLNTDVGKVIVDGGFGWWCESNNVYSFRDIILRIIYDDLITMGRVGYKYLIDHYSVEEAYRIILNRCKEANS